MTQQLPTIDEVRQLCDQTKAVLNAEIARLKAQKFDMEAEYDKDIAKLEEELRMLGGIVPQIRRATDISEVGQRMYHWLLEHPGSHTAGEILQDIKSNGVPSVILQPFINAGRVTKLGEHRSSRYQAVEACISTPEYDAEEA